MPAPLLLATVPARQSYATVIQTFKAATSTELYISAKDWWRCCAGPRLRIDIQDGAQLAESIAYAPQAALLAALSVLLVADQSLGVCAAQPRRGCQLGIGSVCTVYHSQTLTIWPLR